MTLSLLIPEDLQIGAVSSEEARPIAVQRALMRKIQQSLFNNADELDEAVQGFANLLAGVSITNGAAKTYWQCLTAVPATPEAPAGGGAAAEHGADGDGKDQRTDGGPGTALFCLALHGLCGAIVEERLGWKGSGDAVAEDAVTENEVGGDEEDWEENDGESAADAEAGAQPGVVHAAAVRGIAELLRRRTWKALRKATIDKTTQREVVAFVATILLDGLVKVFARRIEVRQQRKGAPRRIVLCDQHLVRRIESFLADLPFHFTPQPLREPVCYEFDKDDDGDEPGFRVDLIGYRRRNKFIADLHRDAIARKNRKCEFATYVQAVNAQMAVAWRINRPLFELVRCLTQIAAGKGRWDDATQDRVNAAELDKQEIEDLCGWVREKLFRPRYARPRSAHGLPGEFLDHIQAKQVLDDLVGKTGGEENPPFYLPWKADYRGRIYAHTPWLTPQGGDVQRALFEFAEGRKLDETGVKALRRHGANLVRTGRILKDLDIQDRRVVTLEERECWVERNEETILRSAINPLRERFWRDGDIVKKPIQFLAFCLAYRQWKDDKCVHLPVQIDGSCNGLQHIAALTGDEKLARAVNVLPQEDGFPGDIYSDLAAEAANWIIGDKAAKGPDAPGFCFGNAWLTRMGEVAQLLDRDTSKRVVMTIPYGATRSTQAAKVLEAIEATIETAWKDCPAPEGLDEVLDWVRNKEDRVKFVESCTRECFHGRREKARGDESARADLWRLQVVAAYVSLTLVARLRLALSEKFPVADGFSKWLDQKASACVGMPFVWFSPLGFPVCQDGFQLDKGSISGKVGEQVAKLDLRRLGMTISRTKQRNGLMPNLIHSLDATHLAMVLCAAQKDGLGGIGTIHDCLLCHPNDADRLAMIVRREFARLYEPDESGAPAVRVAWERWMDLLGRMRLPGEWHRLKQALDNSRHRTDLDGWKGLACSNIRAKQSLELLPELQGLAGPEALLVRVLLDFLDDHFKKTDHEKKREEDERDGKEKPTRPRPPNTLEHKSLNLDDGKPMSPYFFS